MLCARYHPSNLPEALPILFLCVVLHAILPVESRPWTLVADAHSHLGVAVATVSPFQLETVLTQAVRLGRFDMWAFLININSAALATWISSANRVGVAVDGPPRPGSGNPSR